MFLDHRAKQYVGLLMHAIMNVRDKSQHFKWHASNLERGIATSQVYSQAYGTVLISKMCPDFDSCPDFCPDFRR